MSNPSVVQIQLQAAVSNGIAQSQTPGGAGNLTINGSLATSGVATMDVARRVLIASSGADSAIVFTLVGGDRYGNSQSETITGVASGSSQYSVRDYLTVTKVSVSAGTAGAITVGTNGVGSSEWVVDDFMKTVWELSGGIIGASGTTYTLEHTYSDPNKVGTSLVPEPYGYSIGPGSPSPPNVWPYDGLVAASGSHQFKYSNNPVFAHRITVVSGTGLVEMESLQAGLKL